MVVPADESTNLRLPDQQAVEKLPAGTDVQLQGVYEQQLGDDDTPSLKVDRLPAVILEVIDLEHGRVDEPGDLGEDPFEVGEEGRVVERPF